MPTQAKVATVAELTDRLNRAQMLLVADYRGLTVAELSELRKKVREKGGEVIIAKNTLTRLAAREAGKTEIEEFLGGPTALAFSYDDIPGVAKAIDDFFKASKKDIKIKGGLVGTSKITGADVERVSKMATREQSLAKILGGINAPASRIVGGLKGVMRNIAYILGAHAQKGAEG